jgi:hypothetical protein
MRSLWIIGAVFVLGCSGKIDSGADASSPGDAGSDGSVVTTTGLAGTWVGYVESYKFGDGSDAVTMTLSDTGVGTTFFGSGPALPPPTDPDVGYPPSGVDPREGFDFTNLQPTFAAPRLTLSISSNEVHKKWCEIQTVIYPAYNAESDGGCGPLLGYNCLPNAATQGGSPCFWSSCDHPTWTQVDCGKMTLCGSMGGVCSCTSTSCTVATPTAGNIAFDVQLSGNKLDGSVTGLDGGTLNVHLTRQ